MSLIPSESYSFPDHFTRTVVPSREPNPEERPAAAPRINPEPIRSKAPVATPNPALRRVSAPPPRIPDAPMRKMPLPPTLKPKVRWNTRAPAMDGRAPTSENGTALVAPITAARNVIPMNRPRVVRPPRVMPPPQASVVQNFAPGRLPEPIAPAQMQSVPAKPRPVAASNPQVDFFATLARTREIAILAQTRETALSNQRQKMKFRRFIVCECAALGALLPLAIVGLSYHPTNAAVVWIINISAVASAVTAALIPIIFYAFTPTLPEIER